MVQNNKPNFEKKSFSEIQLDWQNAQQLDVRKKVKAMKKLGFDLITSYDKELLTPDEINEYRRILQKISRNPAVDVRQFKTFSSKLTADFMEKKRDWCCRGAKKVECRYCNGDSNVCHCFK